MFFDTNFDESPGRLLNFRPLWEGTYYRGVGGGGLIKFYRKKHKVVVENNIMCICHDKIRDFLTEIECPCSSGT